MDLFSQFIDTWKTLKLSFTVKEIRAEWYNIQSAYTPRAYHNLSHIEYMLKHLNAGEESMAAFYHDLYQENGILAGENERKCGTYAYNLIVKQGGSYWSAIEVRRAIEATAHKEKTSRPIAQNVADADLAILAAPYNDYLNYIKGIEKEYPQYTKEQFNNGRITFLESFLAKENFYYNRPIWETSARANLETELRFRREYVHS